MDNNDGRLALLKNRRNSIDFLGKSIDHAAIIRWNSERKARIQERQIELLSHQAPDKSFTSVKTKGGGGLDTTRPGPSQTTTPRPFNPRPRRASLFSQHGGAEKREILVIKEEEREKEERKTVPQKAKGYSRRMRYLIDEEAAEIDDFLKDEENEMYENLAQYFLRISNSIVASGGLLVDIN